MKIVKFILVSHIILFIGFLVMGCQGFSIQNAKEELYGTKMLYDYIERGFPDAIHDSDFCVIGNVQVKNMEIINNASGQNQYDDKGNFIRELPKEYKLTGEIEVESVIYGNLSINSIPFATLQRCGPFSFTKKIPPELRPIVREWKIKLLKSMGKSENDLPPEEEQKEQPDEFERDVWASLHPKEGDMFIIMGKGEGKNTRIIKPLRLYPSDMKDITLRVENFRIIKNIERLPEKEQYTEREKLLDKTDNIELLSYLFARGFKEGGLDRQVAIVNSMFNDGKTTPQRKAIAYLLSWHIINPPSIEYEEGNIIYIPYEYYQNITPSQRQTLDKIIAQSCSEIKDIKEGIIYLESIQPKILQKDNWLKEQLKDIIAELSIRFKNDKSYPEWEKWVNKIFPTETKEEKNGKE